MAEELIRTRFFNDSYIVNYYRFEGNSNDSKGSNNGSDTNMVYGTSYGKFGQGASFNGSNAHISFDTSFTYSNFTISTWIWPNTQSDWTSVFINSANNSGSPASLFEMSHYNVANSYYFGILNGSSAVIFTLPYQTWSHVTCVYDGTYPSVYVNGMYVGSGVAITLSYSNQQLQLGGRKNDWGWAWHWAGCLDDFTIFQRVLTASEISDLYIGTKSKFVQGKPASAGTLVKNNDNSLGTDLVAWKKFQTMLMKSVNGGTIFSKDIVSTYSLIYTNATAAYQGGVVAANGDIHFIPRTAPVGQTVSLTGVVSTYSLVYTNGTAAYSGAVLAPNGDIHFIPSCAVVGQKISASGVVSTYSLIYTNVYTYYGGVLAPNGDIHFVPNNASVGQKISASGVVSTYSLVRTPLGGETGGYVGGVLAPNGDIHFIPSSSTVGQKVSSSGVVSTYSLVNSNGNERFIGGVLSPNGDIHFVPACGSTGQKVSISGVVSTYSLVYTTSNYAYLGGVLAPNGDIHFVPCGAPIGQKVSLSGVVSTYSLTHTVGYNYFGGIAAQNGDIHFVPHSNNVGQKISTFPAIPFGQTICQSPFFNKF